MNNQRISILLFACLAALFGLTCISLAQTTTGTILGTVPRRRVR